MKRMTFIITIKGEDSLENKFETVLKEKPNLHMDFIKAIATIIMQQLNIDKSDDMIVESFRAGIMPDLPKTNEKKVDS